MKKILLLGTLLSFGTAYGQDAPKSFLFGGIGYGVSAPPHRVIARDDMSLLGDGMVLSIGYQRDIWKNRLRVVPSLSFGTHVGGDMVISPQMYFNSTNIKVNVNYDVFKIKTFALFIGTGLTVNYMAGVVDAYSSPSGGRPFLAFREGNFTFNGVMGFRIIPKNSRIGYELLLMDVSAENGHGFFEQSISLRLILGLQ